MTDIEVALTNIGEIAVGDIAREENPQGLKENLKVAKRGGGASKSARDLFEKLYLECNRSKIDIKKAGPTYNWVIEK